MIVNYVVHILCKRQDLNCIETSFSLTFAFMKKIRTMKKIIISIAILFSTSILFAQMTSVPIAKLETLHSTIVGEDYKLQISLP